MQYKLLNFVSQSSIKDDANDLPDITTKLTFHDAKTVEISRKNRQERFSHDRITKIQSLAHLLKHRERYLFPALRSVGNKHAFSRCFNIPGVFFPSVTYTPMSKPKKEEKKKRPFSLVVSPKAAEKNKKRIMKKKRQVFAAILKKHREK